MSEMDWKKLKDYRCPMIGCDSPLKQVNGVISQMTYHKCTGCDFHISDKKLCEVTIVKNRKLDPPAFMEEMINQDRLNSL